MSSIKKEEYNFNPPSNYSESITKHDNKKYIAIITLVAILAIGVAVVGILAIIAPLSSASGLGAISQIGLQAGGALTAIGITTLITLIIIKVVRYCHSSKKNEGKESQNIGNATILLEQSHSSHLTSTTSAEENDASSTTNNLSLTTSQTFSLQKVDNQPIKQSVSLETILEELKIANLNQYLKEIYGDDVIPLPDNTSSTSCIFYEKIVKLTLLTNEEFFSLKLDDIAGFSSEELSVVNQRLLLSERKLWKIPPKALESGEHLTLGTLRSMNENQVFAVHIPENCLGLLSAVQLESIFTNKTDLTTKLVQQLLPENEYTYYRLRRFNYLSIASHLEQMTVDLFRYLPIECFALDSFPWDMVTSSAENFKKLFPLSNFKTSYFDECDNDFTKKVFGIINITTINRLASWFSLDHLPLIPEDKLKDKNFPWLEFVNRKGAGSKLHCLPSKLLMETHIPWETFANKKDELEKLLNTSRSMTIDQTDRGKYRKEWDDDFTRNILGGVSIKIIQAFAPLLSLDHLRFIPEDKLKDKDFPWLEFVNRKGAGSKLHDLPSKLLMETHIPWEAFANKKDELEKLLVTSRCKSEDQEWYDDFTRNILGKLDYVVIQEFAPHLRLKHLLFFGARLKEKNFPWPLFLKKEGVAVFLHDHYKYIGRDVFASEFFPWLSFSKSEILSILPTSYNTDTSVRILNVIHKTLLKDLISKEMLSNEHLKLLKS